MKAINLLTLLKNNQFIDEAQFTDMMEEHERNSKPIMDIVADFGILSKDDQYQLIAGELGAEIYDLNGMEFSSDVLESIPAQVARINGAFPVANQDGCVFVALLDPLDPQVIDNLRFATNLELQVVVAPIEQVQECIGRFYQSSTAQVEDLLTEMGGDLNIREDDPESEKVGLEAASSAPIIKFVNTVLAQAIQAKASDIHFEPFEHEFKIRYRVDGALYEMAPPPKSLALSVISRIKVISNLNIAERRIPQDGRIQTIIAGRNVDLRVSTLPTQFGESVVLRVLDRSAVNLDLETLGLPDYLFKYICEVIEKPNGIFIVTGPTGSGKTTTLYSCLRRINTIDSKMLTVEDPVEYELEGIMQVPANESIGLSFARVLRAFLRQDPDRIMLGETRDLETAQIAIQAALTGHFVLTTLHTNDAAGAVTRLLDMGVEPFLISAALEGILAQRLIRKICQNCRTPYEPSEIVLQQLGLSPHEVGDKSFYFGKGCDQCNRSGYKGRKGIYELLDMSEPIRDLITQRAPSVVIKQKAVELGMVTLRQDGIRNIFDGLATIEEVVKYT